MKKIISILSLIFIITIAVNAQNVKGYNLGASGDTLNASGTLTNTVQLKGTNPYIIGIQGSSESVSGTVSVNGVVTYSLNGVDFEATSFGTIALTASDTSVIAWDTIPTGGWIKEVWTATTTTQTTRINSFMQATEQK